MPLLVPAIPRLTSFTVIPCKSDSLVKDCQKNSGSFKLLQFYCRHFGEVMQYCLHVHE